MALTGEGSRGGHVIGHTKSGKPIYLSGQPKTDLSGVDHHEAAGIHRAEADRLRKTNPKQARLHEHIAHKHESEAAGILSRREDLHRWLKL